MYGSVRGVSTAEGDGRQPAAYHARGRRLDAVRAQHSHGGAPDASSLAACSGLLATREGSGCMPPAWTPSRVGDAIGTGPRWCKRAATSDGAHGDNLGSWRPRRWGRWEPHHAANLHAGADRFRRSRIVEGRRVRCHGPLARAQGCWAVVGPGRCCWRWRRRRRRRRRCPTNITTTASGTRIAIVATCPRRAVSDKECVLLHVCILLFARLSCGALESCDTAQPREYVCQPPSPPSHHAGCPMVYLIEQQVFRPATSLCVPRASLLAAAIKPASFHVL